MRRRLALASSLVLVAALGSAARGADAPSPSFTPPVGDRTAVRGDVPQDDLLGRWLIVLRASTDAEVKVDEPRGLEGEAGIRGVSQTGSAVVPVYRTLEIRRDGERVVLYLHRQQLPEDLQKKALAGVKPEDKSVPVPDGALRAEVGERWGELERRGGEQQSVDAQIIEFSSVTEEEKAQLGVPGTKLFIVTTEEYAGGTGLQRNTTTYAVSEIAEGRMSGKALQAMVLPARNMGNLQIPPLPVALQGDFVAVRIDEPTAPAGAKDSGGFFSRLFSGCSR